MKICVCIKQVPDVSAPLQVQDGALTFSSDRAVMNAYDASAVEAALDLFERHDLKGEIHLLLAGPQAGQEALRKGLAMGADSATHLEVPADNEYDSAAYAALLAEHLADSDFDVIFCGKQSQDTDAGLAGSMLAEHLKRPYVTNAVGLDLDGDRLVVTRQGDGGEEIVALALPALVTISNDMNDPRIPKLRGIMQAKRKPIEQVEAGAGGAATRTRVTRHEERPERSPAEMLSGSADEQVAALVERLGR